MQQNHHSNFSKKKKRKIKRTSNWSLRPIIAFEIELCVGNVLDTLQHQLENGYQLI